MKKIKPTASCKTCNTSLRDEYCQKCGEKVVRDGDFTFRKLSEQMIDIFTHVDSKLFLSFYSLVAKPGFLTIEYIRGVRKPYMKPFQIFLLSNILFFLLLGKVSIFLIPSSWFFDSELSTKEIPQYAKAIASAQNISIENLATLYDAKVTTNSKFFIVLLVPLLALCSYLFGYKTHREYGKHLIYAIHLLAFILLLGVFFFQVLNPVFSLGIPLTRNLAFATILVYVFLSYRRFVKQALGWQLLATVSMGIWLVLLIQIYRYAVSWITLWIIQ